MHLYPWRRKVAAQVAEELKTVTYAIPDNAVQLLQLLRSWIDFGIKLFFDLRVLSFGVRKRRPEGRRLLCSAEQGYGCCHLQSFWPFVPPDNRTAHTNLFASLQQPCCIHSPPISVPHTMCPLPCCRDCSDCRMLVLGNYDKAQNYKLNGGKVKHAYMSCLGFKNKKQRKKKIRCRVNYNVRYQ